MQFRLLHLLAATTGVCILIGLVFVTPPLIGVPILIVLLPCLPAIWVAGTIYAQGARRAFFVGSLASGATYWLIAIYQCFNPMDGALLVWRSGGFGSWNDWLWPGYHDSHTWASNLIIASPWIAGLIGGVAALITFRFFAVRATVSN